MEGDDRGPGAAHRPPAPDLHRRRLARLHGGGGPLRRLGAADAAAFRALRLDALRGEPNGFGTSWAEEADQPLAWFAERLESNHVIASGDPLTGMAGLHFENRLKRRHIAILWGVFVRPEARGTGLARTLVGAAIEAARGRVAFLRLTVDANNAPANRLYRSLGFVEYGLEPAGLRVDGLDIDDRLMTLALSAPG